MLELRVGTRMDLELGFVSSVYRRVGKPGTLRYEHIPYNKFVFNIEY